jgi:hypothetical protein
MRANPYVIRANFKTAVIPWPELLEHEPGIANKILGLSAARVFASRVFYKRLPDALQPQEGHVLYDEELPVHALMEQTLKIERPRQRIEGHSPEDTLTVTLSTVVDRNWSGFQNTTQEFQDAVCAAMDMPPRTWTNVFKIRLRRGLGYDFRRIYVDVVQRVWRRNHYREQTVQLDTFLHTDGTTWVSEHDFAHRLTDELQLHWRNVRGVNEYSV